MKVVLFCGGFGMRLRGYSESVPKPLVEIGDRPILLHIMQYYASFGHKDFILCLGWKSQAIESFFLNHSDSTNHQNGSSSSCQFQDWNIQFVETGLHATVGERLKKLEGMLRNEKYFFANYADGLCNVDLDGLTRFHESSDAVATFLSVNPTQSFHTVVAKRNGQVVAVDAIGDQGIWMNGGYFVLSGDFFEYLDDGEELVEKPFQRLIDRQRLMTYRHHGFWSCMDTYKEMQQLEEMFSNGDTPWAIWDGTHPPVFDYDQIVQSSSNPTNSSS